jgi:long-chain fatty acid transport protein
MELKGGIMNYRKGLLALVAAPIFIAGAAGTVHAAGYALFTQGAAALGQGNAVTAHNDSPNAIFFNPALMSKLDGTQIDVGTTMIYAKHEYEARFPGYNTSNSDFFFPSTFYATHKINDKFSAGFGIFNPFGLGTHWGETWQGRYYGTKSDLETFNFNPVVSYQVWPGLSVAAGADIIHVDATLQQKVSTGTLVDLNERFTGDGTSAGFNIAAAYDINDQLSVGASYRSEVDVDLGGTATVTALPIEIRGKATVKLPAQFTAGIAYKVTNPFVVEAGIRWEEWSAFQDLTIRMQSGNVVYSPRHWHNTLGFNLGGKYQLNEITAVSAGYIYGENAAPGYTFDAKIPDADTHIFCIGSSFYLNPLRIDLAYAYQLYEDRTKNNTIGSPLWGQGPNLLSAANGKYKSDAHLLSVNVGYRF